MKVLKYTGIVFLILFVLFCILPVGLVQIPAVQRKLADGAAHYIENKLHTKVEIERIRFRSVNKLELRNVYLADQAGDTLFKANRVAAGMQLLPMLRKQYKVNSVQLFSFDLRLRKATAEAPLNIQHLIDAFRSDEEKKKEPVEIRISNVRLHSGRISYDVEDQEPLSDRLDANHIAIEDLAGKLHFGKLKNEDLDISVKRFRFKEKSGLEIVELSFDLAANPEQMRVDQLVLKLPDSRLNLKDFEANYESYDRIIDETTTLSVGIDFPRIDLNDLDAVLPDLSVLGKNVAIEGHVNGTLNELRVDDISFKEEYGSFLRGSLSVKNLFSKESPIYVSAGVKNSLFRKAYLKRLAIADELGRVGDITFSGALSGYLSELTAVGNIGTDIGNLTADFKFGQQADYFFNGHVASPGFELGSLLNNPDLGRIVFDIDMNSVWKDKTSYSAKLTAQVPLIEYQGHAYDEIKIDGLLTNGSYEGVFSMDGAKGQLLAQGSVVLQDANSEFRLLVDGEGVNLDGFRFTSNYNKPIVSFAGDINFKGNEFDNIDGSVVLNDFVLTTEEHAFRMDSLIIDSYRSKEASRVVVRSDILDAEIEGNYSTRSIANQLKRSLAHYLPSLVPDTLTKSDEHNNEFNFHAVIGDMQDLFSLLKLPFGLSEHSVISGFYNNLENQLHAEAFIPGFDVVGMEIDSCFMELDNRNEELRLNLIGTNLQDNYSVDMNANFLAHNDSVHGRLEWLSSKKERYEGVLDMDAFLALDEGLIRGNLHINQTEMTFNDSVWTLYPTVIRLDGDRIAVNDLRAEHRSQFVYIDGVVSHNPDDNISAELGSVDLEYIFTTLNIPALEFGGKATGTVDAKDLYLTRQLNTQLYVSDFSFNNTLFGNLDLNGKWMDEERGVKLTGHVAKNDSTYVDIDGNIYPVSKELSIHFHPQNADMAFLRKYIGNIAKEISGEVTGHVHLVGDLNDPTVEGSVDVKNGRFGIEFLNTWYNFDHRVDMDRSRISLNNMTLRDDYGKEANVSAWVTHNLFSDFRYQADFSFVDFFVFGATERANPQFYGKAFGTGSATIAGTERDVNISVNMENTEHTAITFNFMDKQDIEEYSFITFKEKNPPEKKIEPVIRNGRKKKATEKDTRKDQKTNLRLNLLVDVNPNAQIGAVMDPVGGDMISGRGNGRLEVQYATNDPLWLMGKYTIDEGQYDFSLEQLYFRKFAIHQGSSITFKGDPMQAALDVKAAYTVQASLSDLDQQLLNYSAKSRVPVDCVINVSGQLEYPNISFDIELPDAPAELERQVKRYMRTEDLLNRQMLYLLVLNRFYTSPEFTTSNTRTNNELSLLTSTLSTQLSNLLGALNDKVQIGTQFHQSYEGEEARTEVELMLSSMLFDNRLIIYGNVGYIDNPYIKNVNGNDVPLVGDFDVEYKLTPTGDIRLKGFNHYNYRNYFSIAPEWTQGIGILFRRDFDNLIDLFGKKKGKKPESDSDPTPDVD